MRDLINYIVFGWYPYLCLTVFLLGSLLRFDREQYTWRSGSSQLLRRRQLIWGSNLFHVGILVIFLGHFVGLLTPIWIFDALGISHTFKQWMAIVVGGVAGVMCFIGITLLVHRRLFDARIRTTSSFGDIAILLLLYAQLILGLATISVSLSHLDGHEMVKFMTWAQGILTLQPGVSALIADVHPIFKLHLFLGMTIFLVFPFTRLVHVWSAPIWYLGRRGYQVVRTRGGRAALDAGGVAAMTACSAHAQIPAGKPAAVSVNGVAIAARRDRARDAAPSGAQADRGLAAGRARAGHPRTAAAGGAPSRRRRRSRSATPTAGARPTRKRIMRALVEREVAVPEPDEETCRRYYEQQPARASARPTSTRPRISCSRRCRRIAQAYAQARADAAAVLAELARTARSALPNWREAHSRCPSAAQGGNLGQITAGQTTPEFEQALFALAPGELCAGAGRDPLRLPRHPARSQARGPHAAL